MMRTTSPSDRLPNRHADVRFPKDRSSALDSVRDTANLPLEAEPQRARDDLKSLTATR
jgi:hypothetical protein